jgi:hypothetical protein
MLQMVQGQRQGFAWLCFLLLSAFCPTFCSSCYFYSFESTTFIYMILVISRSC